MLAGLAAAAVLSLVGSQVGVRTEPWNGMLPSGLVTLPFTMIGGSMQSAENATGGRIQAVVPATLPASPSLQSVVPWSKAQLCPPPVGAPVVWSAVELSGMKNEPSVAVKTLGDQLAATGTAALPIW